MMDKNRVEEILKESKALLTGHFILTSGKHSDHYMQCARISQYPEFNAELCADLAENFQDERVDVVVGPATGGIIVAYELARQLAVNSIFAERENSKMTLRRGFYIQPGDRVVVAEDVITTGGSVQEVIDLVRSLGGEVVGVCVLVDRSMGKADFGVPFFSSYKASFQTYEADDCPICKDGKIEAIKPGSRNLK